MMQHSLYFVRDFASISCDIEVVGFFLDSQLCGEKLNTIKPSRGQIGRLGESEISQPKERKEERKSTDQPCQNHDISFVNSWIGLELDNRFLQFKEDIFLLDHLNEFQGILDQMLRMGIKFEDEILRLLLLNSLPKF
ncbi:hypothetical protein CR513_61095, partial [Mucuna pruriens]